MRRVAQREDIDHFIAALARRATNQRGHALDVTDVEQMFHRAFIEPAQLKNLFEAIVPQLYRYPALDPPGFRRALEKMLADLKKS